MLGTFRRISVSAVKTSQRKLAWLPLAGVLPLLGLGCAPSVTLTAPAPIVPAATLKGVQVALVEFVPLPKTYPVGAKAYFPALTRELYEEERTVRDRKAGLDPRISFVKKVTVRTFVPRDHLTILTETMLLFMKEKGVTISLAPTLGAARESGASLIVTGVLSEFKVGQPSDETVFMRSHGLFTNAQANVRVSIMIFSGPTGARLWEGQFQSTVIHTEILTNALHATWIEVLGMSETSFHPLRVLLAVATYNLAAQLVDRLEQTVGLTGGPIR